jgi:hypothetical protein
VRKTKKEQKWRDEMTLKMLTIKLVKVLFDIEIEKIEKIEEKIENYEQLIKQNT